MILNAKKGHGSFITFDVAEYHFWIYCCAWTIASGDQLLAHNESSDDAIIRAVELINGQEITEISMNSKTLTVSFNFNSGIRIIITDDDYEPGTELIMVSNAMRWLSLNNLRKVDISEEGKITSSYSNIIEVWPNNSVK